MNLCKKKIFLFIKLSFTLLLFFFLSVKTFGQTKVYATNYGSRQSGPGVLGLTSAGLVANPGNAVDNSVTNPTTFAGLTIGGLLGSAYAELQLKFINGSQNLPAGTSVYVRLDNNISSGLLGLLGATNGFVTAYKDAPSGNTTTNSTGGTAVTLNAADVVAITIGGQQYLRITPTQCFNAVRFAITTGGLLGLLSSADLKIYEAYYNCPTITIPTPAPICSGSSASLSIMNPDASCTIYSWYSVASGGTALGTGTTFNTGALSSTQIFYVGASSSDGSCERTAVTVTVNSVTAGSINGNQTICSGGTPTGLTVNTAATGSGTLSYQWQSNSGSGYTNIVGATLATYSPPSLTVTTSYQRIATSTLNSVVCTVTSNAVAIMVNSVTAGSINGNQTICSGGTPTVLTVNTAATSSGTLSYQWQSNSGSGYTNIVGATLATYSPPSLTVTTSYQRIATSTLNSVVCTATSNAVTVTVNSVTAGSINGNQTICSGGTPTGLTVNTAATGSGTLSYQWQSNSGSGYTNIVGATLATYSPPSLTVTTSYQRIVTSILNSVVCTGISNTVTITINPLPTFVLGINPRICRGITLVVLSYGTTTGNPITYSLQWDGAAITAGLVNVNNSLLSGTIEIVIPAGIVAGTYNGIVRVKNNTCESIDKAFTITVYPNPGYPDLSILAID